MPRTLLQLMRFGTVGAANTAISFLAYAGALRLGVRYLPAGAGAFALGALNGFVLNRAWTFAHRGPALQAGWRYLVVQLTGLIADVALLRLVVHAIGLGRLPAQLLAAVPVTLLCFALSRVWVFDARRLRGQPVAHAAHGEQQLRRLGALLELLAQVADVDVDPARVAVRAVPPDRAQELVAREEVAGAAHERLHDLELREREVDAGAADAHLAAQPVELEVADGEHRIAERARPGAPQHGLDAAA